MSIFSSGKGVNVFFCFFFCKNHINIFIVRCKKFCRVFYQLCRFVLMGNYIFFQVPRDQAVIVALCHSKAKAIASAKIQNLKTACKELCVSYSRTSTKENLLCSLGRFCLKTLDIHIGIVNIYVYSTCKP